MDVNVSVIYLSNGIETECSATELHFQLTTFVNYDVFFEIRQVPETIALSHIITGKRSGEIFNSAKRDSQ